MSRIIDPYGVPDVYVQKLAQIETLGGGNYRFIYATTQNIGGSMEDVATAKLVSHYTIVPPALVMIAEVMGAKWDGEWLPMLQVN